MFYEVSKSVMVWIVAPDTLFSERKNRTEDQIYVRRKTHLMTSISLFYKQVSVAAVASHIAEVSGLNQSLERSTEELGQLKRKLEDKQGMHKPCSGSVRTNLFFKICFVICARGDDRSRGSEEGYCRG